MSFGNPFYDLALTLNALPTRFHPSPRPNEGDFFFNIWETMMNEKEHEYNTLYTDRQRLISTIESCLKSVQTQTQTPSENDKINSGLPGCTANVIRNQYEPCGKATNQFNGQKKLCKAHDTLKTIGHDIYKEHKYGVSITLDQYIQLLYYFSFTFYGCLDANHFHAHIYGHIQHLKQIDFLIMYKSTILDTFGYTSFFNTCANKTLDFCKERYGYDSDYDNMSNVTCDVADDIIDGTFWRPRNSIHIGYKSEYIGINEKLDVSKQRCYRRMGWDDFEYYKWEWEGISEGVQCDICYLPFEMNDWVRLYQDIYEKQLDWDRRNIDNSVCFLKDLWPVNKYAPKPEWNDTMYDIKPSYIQSILDKEYEYRFSEDINKITRLKADRLASLSGTDENRTNNVNCNKNGGIRGKRKLEELGNGIDDGKPPPKKLRINRLDPTK